MKFWPFLLLACGFAVHAADGYVIKQLLLNRNRVVVEGSGLKAGQELIATFRNGSQCMLKVTAVQGRIANADTSECRGAEYLTAGQTVERNLSIEENAPVKSARPNVNERPTPTKMEWTPRPAPPRLLSDLQYLPRAGQWAGKADYGYTKVNSSLSTTNSKDTVMDVEVESHTLNVGALYALNEKFAFGVQTGYLLARNTQNKYGPAAGGTLDGTTEKTKADGLTDPTLAAYWRLTEMDTVPAILQLKASYSPNSGKNKAGTVDNKGSGFRGGDLFSLGFEAGYKQATYALLFGLDLDYYGSTNTVDATSGVGTARSGTNAFTLRFAGQLDLSEGWFLRGQLARLSMGETSRNQEGSTEMKYDSVAQTLLSVGAFKELNEHLGLELTVARALSADQSVKQGNTSYNQSLEALGVNLSLLAAF